MVQVPSSVREKARAAGAVDWLDRLPSLVAELEQLWSMQVGRAYGDATEAFVAEATVNGGAPAVLKLVIPRGSAPARREITALRLMGPGSVRLLAYDHSGGALLMERLGPSMYELRLPIRKRHEILCALALQVWRPAPGYDLPTGADHGRWLTETIPVAWEELDRPCSARAVAHALACAKRRIAAHGERAVLVHGDIHQWNALRAGDGFRLIDPDGLVAEPEFDLGVLMREDPVELMQGDPYDRARQLAARTGLDANAIWEWGVAQRVATGLVLTRIGLQPVARQMLAAADRIAPAHG